jgi:two-component system NtrC family sensor kinase
MSESTGDGAGGRPQRPGESLVLQLETADERLQVALGLAEGIVFEFDPEGRYLEVWTRSEELLVAPREQMLGRTIPEVMGAQLAAPFLERIRHILATGQVERFEYSLDLKGGLRWFSADGLKVPSRQSVVLVVRDITRSKLLEQRLLQADRLAALGTLAAGVTHEINNPLSYIFSNTNFIAEGLEAVRYILKGGGVAPELERVDQILKECADALSELREGTTRIRQVVSDLKMFARGDDKRIGQADVKRALESSINVAMPQLRSRARLVKQVEEVPAVRGNEARLGQVFLNLLMNAAQAIPEGEPERHRVDVRLRQEGRHVVLEVKDTGHGIPAELLQRIFDPFFSTRPMRVGTGLGLSICHGIVTGMGGEISVESVEGQGACFRVRLPAA